MNPISSSGYKNSFSVNSVQQRASSRAPATYNHPGSLSLALLSSDTFSILDQKENKFSGSHKRLILLARSGIADGTLRMSSSQSSHATYKQRVNLPDAGQADLTVKTRLNEKSQYEITEIGLHIHASDITEAMSLPTSAGAKKSTYDADRRQHNQDNPLNSIEKTIITSEVSSSTNPRPSRQATSTLPSASSSINPGGRKVSQQFNEAVASLIKEMSPKLFRSRPSEFKTVIELLSPLQGKGQLNGKDQLALIDASDQLQKVVSAKPNKYPGATAMITHIDQVVASAPELYQTVGQLASDLEHKASVLSFVEYLQKNHPSMIDDAKGRLTPEGAKNYASLKQRFDLETQNRHVLSPTATRLSESEAAVVKLIEGGYRDFQDALRQPDGTMLTRKRLLECVNIVKQLATAKPEEVNKERIATVFPGGITDPAKLEPGKIYREKGFVFVGGERPSDRGHVMQIKMTKGYPVDARKYYGHSGNNEDKQQWISLPGANFRFDGIKDEYGKKSYLFTQISR
ncbi:hypothetical protein [Serratia ficaria]|uniref:hypothetical protein n=1 Tax=Serratia ficaria TaxID=61651 RepID=UPI000AF38008|nr:hypothetical protein [Serratia ficaria]